MKRIMYLLLSLSLLILMVYKPVFATTKINSYDEIIYKTITIDESITVPYAIKSKAWYTNWSGYVTLVGNNQNAPFANPEITFVYRLGSTYRYNEATGKIYGSVPPLRVEIIDAGSNTDEMWVESIHAPGTITDNGYTITYSNVSFVIGAKNSLNDSFLTFSYGPYTVGDVRMPD